MQWLALDGGCIYAGRVVASIRRYAGRWFNPTTLVLAGLCFTLPFVTVACDTPGGYGRAAPGGTTSYTGMDLVLGGEPDVSPPDKVRQAAEVRDARLGPQAAAAAALLAIVAGTGFAIGLTDVRARRVSVAAVAGVAAAALLMNQALVEADLAVRVGNQLTAPLPDGKNLRDFIKTGPGFGLCLLLLVLVVVVNAVGWWRTRTPPALIPHDAP